MIVLNVAGC